MKKSNKEDAVSPVIGVMLMLVVTIIIAAVVAAFATGMGSDVDMAPAAALDVIVYDDGNVVLTHVSGERLIPGDIKIKLQDDGDELGSAALDYSGTYFAPGSTAKVQVIADGEGDNDKLKVDEYVTVVVTAEDKYTVTSKDVMVKKAL